MTDPFTVTAFIERFFADAEPPNPDELRPLFATISTHGRPRALQALIWLLLRTLQREPNLHAALVEEWLPWEKDLVELMQVEFFSDKELPTPEDLCSLLDSLSMGDHAGELHALMWLVLRMFQRHPMLHAAVVQQWPPKEEGLAELLSHGGKEQARSIVAMIGPESLFDRLWQLSDDAEIPYLFRTSDPWEVTARAPIAALKAERQLDELIRAVIQRRQWREPSEILGDDFDIDALLALGKSRMIQKKSGEALSITILRLLRCANQSVLDDWTH